MRGSPDARTVRSSGAGTDTERSAGRAQSREALFEALADETAREILATIGDDALTANEICAATDRPLSTIYRKLETLSEAGLIAEGTRMSASGKHPSEYTRAVEDVRISVGSEAIDVRVAERDRDTSPLSIAASAGD